MQVKVVRTGTRLTGTIPVLGNLSEMRARLSLAANSATTTPDGARIIMLRKIAAVLFMTVLIAAVSAPPADAAKKKKRYRSPSSEQYRPQTPSLDGRVTGQPRTCGSDSLRYDSTGVPVGPYCH
jgi:hypothetical protein